jgi:hypothetical protein
MGIRHRGFAVGLGVLASALALPASAQSVSRTSAYSRPTAVEKPSERLIRSGSAPTARRYSDPGAGTFSTLGRASRGGYAALDQAFQPTAGFSRFVPTRGSSFGSSNRPYNSFLGGGSMSLNRGVIPQIYFPAREGDEFQRFFGLAPAESIPAFSTRSADEPLPRTGTDLAQRMEAQTERSIETNWKLAIALFSSGMNATDAEHFDKLARAMKMLQAVRRLGYHQAEASLLLVHADFETEQFGQAASDLIEAVKVNPDAFVQPAKLASFFPDFNEASGTSQILSNQLRRYVQFGGFNPTSPDAQAFEAYCAWALNDVPRARAALQRLAQLEQQAREKGAPTRFDQFVYSLVPALQ